MNLIRKGHRHAHRGIIGIESAIVLIAFVIVAAALAFVVLNMGFATSQKAKTTIVSSLGEASSSLEISGKVIGVADVGNSVLNATIVPIKITSGGDSINLDNATVSVKYLSNSVEYDNILTATLTANVYQNASEAFEAASRDGSIAGFNAGAGNYGDNPVNETLPTNTAALIYWTVRSNTNAILEQGEHVVLAIAYRTVDRPGALDKIRAEILISSGATLTMERNIPNITSLIVDLG